MWRRRSWWERYRASWLYAGCFGSLRDRNAVPTNSGTTIFRIGCLAILCAASLVLDSEISRAEETDFSPYTRAAGYCRGDVARPIALSPDKKILCLDGPLLYG